MSDQTPTSVVELAVNLDDVTAELIADAQQALMDAGALDAWTTAIGMKKGRPGVCLSVLCRAEDRDTMARRVLALTGSFGVRYRLWDRLVLERQHETVDTALGKMRIKVGRLEGRVVNARPEYEDVRAAGQRAGVSFAQAQRHAEAAATHWLVSQTAREDGR